MTDFLRECGISDEAINELETICSKEMLYNLYCNEYQIKEIINYFNSIGIKCTEDILINFTGLFLETFNDIKKMFEGKDIDRLVKSINEDYNVINDL